jgi:tetratricopeptide (TPR) repeat protein
VAIERREASLARGFYGKLRSRGIQVPETAYNLGLLLQASGDDNAALEYYADAVEHKRDFAPALANLGHALEAVGYHDRALEMWSRAVVVEPALAQGYFAED